MKHYDTCKAIAITYRESPRINEGKTETVPAGGEAATARTVAVPFAAPRTAKAWRAFLKRHILSSDRRFVRLLMTIDAQQYRPEWT